MIKGYKTLVCDFNITMFKLSMIRNSNNEDVNYYTNKLAELASYKVLLLDDFALSDPKPEYAGILKNLLDECSSHSCELIITAQRPVTGWIQFLGGNEVADACVDRIISNYRLIKLTGDSHRVHDPLTNTVTKEANHE